MVEDAGIEPRAVATLALVVRCSITTRLDLILNVIYSPFEKEHVYRKIQGPTDVSYSFISSPAWLLLERANDWAIIAIYCSASPVVALRVWNMPQNSSKKIVGAKYGDHSWGTPDFPLNTFFFDVLSSQIWGFGSSKQAGPCDKLRLFLLQGTVSRDGLNSLKNFRTASGWFFKFWLCFSDSHKKNHHILPVRLRTKAWLNYALICYDYFFHLVH